MWEENFEPTSEFALFVHVVLRREPPMAIPVATLFAHYPFSFWEATVGPVWFLTVLDSYNVNYNGVLLSSNSTRWLINNKTPKSCPCLRQILTDFQNSFTATLSRKLAIKRSLQVLPHLYGGATIPCEILIFENWTDRKHSNCRPSAHAMKRMRPWWMRWNLANRTSHRFIV